MTVKDRVVAAAACQYCGGSVPCRCAQKVQRPGVTRRDEFTEVVLPVGADRDRIRGMLIARGLDPSEWALKTVKVNEWEGFYVRDGESVVVPLTQTTATLEYRPPIEETPWGQFLTGLEHLTGAKASRRRLKPPATRPLTWVLFGDDQAPFVNWPLQELLCELLRDLQPDGLVDMGDLADLPDLSRWRPKDGTDFASSVTRCIDVTHQVHAERVEAAGSKSEGRRFVLVGNHDDRFDKALLDKLPQLFGLRQAATTEDPAPEQLLNVHHLARLGDLGFDTIRDSKGDYPHGSLQLADELLATHGWKAVRGAGNSARASIESLNSGIVVGHSHRLSLSHETRWSPAGEIQVYTAAESGTMADPQGLGYARYPDWQPGFLTVTTRGDGSHHIDLAVYRDRTLRWRDRQWQLTARGVRAA